MPGPEPTAVQVLMEAPEATADPKKTQERGSYPVRVVTVTSNAVISAVCVGSLVIRFAR